MNQQFVPKLFSLVKSGISAKQIIIDIQSGVLVGIIALPLALAFAIASGVSPERGIITAIVAGFVISFLGGSRVQIGGPTGAFIVLVFSINAQYGITGLLTATAMAGIMLIIMGALRMGDLLKYIPYNLIAGFTGAIALIIFSTQMKNFFGMQIDDLPAEFAGQWISYLKHLSTINIYSASIGIMTICLILLVRKKIPRIPGALVCVIFFTSIVYLLKIPVETIGSRYGEISGSIGLEGLTVPSTEMIKALLLPSLSIALLGALESLLSAVVADGLIGSGHRSNIELIAQGVANLASALFGGIPATGAIARTAANIKNGGRTPIAGIVHALVLLLMLLFLAPLAGYIPLAVLAGILVVVAYDMSDIQSFKMICKTNKSEISVLFVTFFLTLFFDLTVAIIASFILAVILFMKRMASSLDILPIMSQKEEDSLFTAEFGEIDSRIAVFEMNGPLFFGSVAELLGVERWIGSKHKVIVLRMRYVPIIDSTGIMRLKALRKLIADKEAVLIISGVNSSIKKILLKNEVVGKSELFDDIKAALKKANSMLR
ncbi:MAG: STAS domain-containing protein [Spirochaetes bacterium]|nr:STAS domain-containing protein [Spirochaetota bacterium]MBN2770054.1 STAS domain-containing protein [Spirochaetota bacterium]